MYKNLIRNSEKFNLQIPQTSIPTPTAQDYQLGFLYRYFLQKANDENAYVYEVSEEIYNSYDPNPFWNKVMVKWRITGTAEPIYENNSKLKDCGIINSNKAALGIASLQIKNISLYLPNLLQFYKR